VLVTGATGLVGSRLVASLLADGIAVRALSRHPTGASRRLGDAVDVRSWDGLRVSDAAVRGCDAIVHLAGEPIFSGRLTETRRRRIRSSRVDSTHALVQVCDSLPSDERPRALVCASAVGYYGSRGEEPLEEGAGPGGGFLADVCREWEAAALAARPAGVRVVCARLGIVLAAEDGALPRMALPFKLGLGGQLGNGRQWFPWIHVDDVVGILRAALRDEALEGPVNAVAPGPVRNAELTETLGRVLRRPTFLRVPAFALRAALGELSGELLGSRRAVPARLRERGFEFAHPQLEEALRAELG